MADDLEEAELPRRGVDLTTDGEAIGIGPPPTLEDRSTGICVIAATSPEPCERHDGPAP